MQKQQRRAQRPLWVLQMLMLVIPIILAFASFGIYKKYYTLKGEKMEEITRKVNEMHEKKQTA